MMRNALLFLFLIGFCFAQTTGFLFSSYSEWMPLAVVIAGLSVVASAALIVLSRMFSLKNLEQIAKTEFVFAMSTVAIVLFVGIIASIGEALLMGVLSSAYYATFGCFILAPQPPADVQTPIDFVILYLDPPKSCAQTVLDTLYYISIPVEAATTQYSEIYMSELATGYGVKAISERIKNTAANLFFYAYAYYILVYVLKFISAFGGFFFTVGVALRAFPPTRGAGAYFMAAALGFYFVFPTIYVIFSALTLPYSWTSTELTKQTYADPSSAANLCTADNINKHYEQLCIRPNAAGLEDLGKSASGGWDAKGVMEAYQFLKAYKGVLTGFLDPSPDSGITALIKRMINAVCIVPLVAMVVTMTFVLNSTNLFGGNIPEIGRGLVKLI